MEQEKLLETFEYGEKQNGHEHFYRITANEDHFAVEKDGCFIAELVCDGDWKTNQRYALAREPNRPVGRPY
jgi:hypothetical protein